MNKPSAFRTVEHVTPVRWRVRLTCGHTVDYAHDEQPVPTSTLFCRQCEIKQQAQERAERESANAQVDTALRDVTRELKRRGIPAEYWHSGGGCMVVRIEVSPKYGWVFGLADVCWGGDFEELDNGHIFSIESSYPAHARIETVCDWIWTLLSPVPFVDIKTQQYIAEPYWDATRRFPVDPWETYGIPYPDGAMLHHLKGFEACFNCTEHYHAVLPNQLCTRCRQPDPVNAD